MTAVRETELKKFLIEGDEPMKHSIWGNRLREKPFFTFVKELSS